jgi:predicted RNA-binding protein YlxR (DUF448 family)/ribosomal protein L7Ae-like RNA K-turn-binding protein
MLDMNDASDAGARKGSRRNSTRTCASCGEEASPEQLVRFVRSDDAQVYPDLKGSLPGRGAWLHPRPECLKKIGPALAKSFKARIDTTSSEAISRLASAGRVRVRHLLGAGRRERLVAEGSELTEEAWNLGQAALVLVAEDARSAADLTAVRQAVARGQARVFSTKSDLGRIFGRPELGVLAVLDERLAQALFGAIALALLAPESDSTSAAHGPGIIGFSEVE